MNNLPLGKFARRTLWGFLLLPFLSVKSEAAPKSGKYVVPKDINLIRVRSFLDGKEVLDTNFKVNPGQIFVIDAVNE